MFYNFLFSLFSLFHMLLLHQSLVSLSYPFFLPGNFPLSVTIFIIAPLSLFWFIVHSLSFFHISSCSYVFLLRIFSLNDFSFSIPC
ncbi:uncharacterized protein BYT42DRAFT_589759 [Radiomyces spectabilis]|uniref:uncharacterized protein n=1 Tax=Radiomyces spectabilis TaxID=64574 RepID=UPI0022204C03|nr:uncharacterized protein BYT42DRAFT_589759 [Radiomyces spectabilis]KAI8365400.1 hypothetical protein BYT42DRAFT_589759 [Radiomyces spectabilis]